MHPDFEAKTLLLFRMARAGMIYLSLGMHREEQRRAHGKDERVLAPMTLDPMPHDWKQ